MPLIDISKKRKDGTLPILKEVTEILVGEFVDAEKALFLFCEKQSVIVDMSNERIENRQRLLDFISGAVFVMHGEIKKIKDKKYILIPEGIKVSGVREKR